mmetsp:Transcript_1446/g.2170  ORF Transcript_1446/g.2170 Transcript_1446/m.2170 type:complete len:86 (-) Transcript_1446:102-359(-)
MNSDGGFEIVGDSVIGRREGEIVGESVLGEIVGISVLGEIVGVSVIMMVSTGESVGKLEGDVVGDTYSHPFELSEAVIIPSPSPS